MVGPYWLAEDVARMVSEGADWLHVDIMVRRHGAGSTRQLDPACLKGACLCFQLLESSTTVLSKPLV